MATQDLSARRRRRLALVGVGWTAVMLTAAVIARSADSPTQPNAVESVRVEHGGVLAPIETPTKTWRSVRLAQVISALADKRTKVWCWSQRDWRKRVDRGFLAWSDREAAWRAYSVAADRTVHLSPEVCAELTKLSTHRESLATYETLDALAWSVGALAHEAQHVAGTFSEVEAECAGMQSIARTARLLGRTAQEGQLLATLYWKHWYLWHGPEIGTYDCANDGPLDLRPTVDAWP